MAPNDEEYDPSALAPDIRTADDLLRLLGAVQRSGAGLEPASVRVAGQLLSLPPYNEIYDLIWCPDHGDGFLLQRFGRTLLVDGRQDVFHNNCNRVPMRRFLVDTMAPSLFSSRMGDTGVRVDLAWDVVVSHTVKKGGTLTLLVGCNRAGSMCDTFRMSFVCGDTPRS